jgi:hypothetical protein
VPGDEEDIETRHEREKVLTKLCGKMKEDRKTHHERKKLFTEQCGKIRKVERLGMKGSKCSENCAGR